MYRFIQNYLAKIATATALLCAPAFAGTVFFAAIWLSAWKETALWAPPGPYTDNQAAPLSLFQYSTARLPSSASFVSSFVLPQAASGANFAVSGERQTVVGRSLQLSGSGQYLTIMGYGINAATFNGSLELTAQATRTLRWRSREALTGQSYTPVARVVALIDRQR